MNSCVVSEGEITKQAVLELLFELSEEELREVCRLKGIDYEQL